MPTNWVIWLDSQKVEQFAYPKHLELDPNNDKTTLWELDPSDIWLNNVIELKHSYNNIAAPIQVKGKLNR